MKKLSRKIIFATLGVLCGVCCAFGGVAAFSHEQAVPVVAEASQETEFTNNGQFTVSGETVFSSDTVYNLEYVDGASENLPSGYSGTVLKVSGKGASGHLAFKVDFGAAQISCVESIVVRIYAPNSGTSDEFRTKSDELRQYGTGTDFTAWQDVTLNSDTLNDLTGTDGNLGSTSIGLRIKSSCTAIYIDSITVTLQTKGTPNVKFTEIHSGWNNNAAGDETNGIGYNTIIEASANLDGASGTADSTNLAKTKNLTSLGVKLNGKTFYELYQENKAENSSYEAEYRIGYNHGFNHFYFCIPESAFVNTQRLE